ncbi:PaaI family thioesterase [Enterobacteriaceae bacterium BIT-l23]|uniref:PaaI family thioesterase n=1 Tax=Jejubacter sp. L23 TaxID=3092086 RepID=UPI001584944E|nr:PaaI family thioesterase [Enterobacteriaceae bacterium BIT-l23]
MNPDALFWKVVNGQLPLSKAAMTLGWRFDRYDEAQGVVHIEYQAGPGLTNPLGNIQGGILSAMLDDCMGPAIYLDLPPGKVALTIESKTSFIHPAAPGVIRGEGWIEQRKGGICFTAGRLLNDSGHILATASATFRIGSLRWHGLTIPGPVADGIMKWKLRRIADS